MEVASRLKENQSSWSSSNCNPKYPKSCQATKSALLLFFWLRLVCCTLPVHRGLWEEHSWSLMLHRLLTAAHTRAASACNAYRNACYHLQRALMSATGSGTAAEHQNKMRFCLEKSPQPPQVSVLKEELELKPLWLPDVGETDVICRV